MVDHTDTGVANTESWDGTSWTEVADLSTARNGVGSSGTTLSALAFGGEDPALPNNSNRRMELLALVT
jgi:hypothetical protein